MTSHPKLSGQQKADSNVSAFVSWIATKTRAERHVILIGDPAAAKAAVEGVPHAARRKVGLGGLVVETLGAFP